LLFPRPWNVRNLYFQERDKLKRGGNPTVEYNSRVEVTVWRRKISTAG
jgi:hypothetical protein